MSVSQRPTISKSLVQVQEPAGRVPFGVAEHGNDHVRAEAVDGVGTREVGPRADLVARDDLVEPRRSRIGGVHDVEVRRPHAGQDEVAPRLRGVAVARRAGVPARVVQLVAEPLHLGAVHDRGCRCRSRGPRPRWRGSRAPRPRCRCRARRCRAAARAGPASPPPARRSPVPLFRSWPWHPPSRAPTKPRLAQDGARAKGGRAAVPAALRAPRGGPRPRGARNPAGRRPEGRV